MKTKGIKQAMIAMLNDVYEYNGNFPKEQVKDIIDAMRLIDRQLFVPAQLINSAYDDAPLPIGEGQTISQPSTVARMLLLLEVEKGKNVLEIGAGSGWNAALLAYLSYPDKVIAVERIEYLTANAKRNISKLNKVLGAKKSRLKNLTLMTEDALDKKSSIWKHKYNRIIITAGIENNDGKTNNLVKEMASKLLKDKGILICPLTIGPLQIYRKNKVLRKEETSEEYVFVPLLRGRE